MSAVGAAVMIAVNVIFVPRMGYMACAWGGFAGYAAAMLMSFFIGRKYYPVQYDLRAILVFTLAAALFYGAYVVVPDKLWLKLSVGTILLAGYGALIVFDLKKRKTSTK